MTMSWRLASRLSVISLALLVVLVVALFSVHNGAGGAATSNPSTSTSNLQGTNLGSTPAPDFLLKDQSGNAISLSQFKGKPVVLTFLYTHCPDVCPLTAEKIHTTMQSLGSNAQHIAVIAVSMDPKGDTAIAAQNFAHAWRTRGCRSGPQHTDFGDALALLLRTRGKRPRRSRRAEKSDELASPHAEPRFWKQHL